jgi:cellulose synthase/poly-beta-1,6-N-acetylglucosamine synthase-like glycosyltransferase
LNYDDYLVYIVADKCDVSTLKFDNEKVILLEPETVLASNVKSHFYAINHFKRKHEVLTIIDSDNLVDPEYLNELNHYFNQGFNAVQGMRAAKKTRSTIARLDSIRDIYYHFYDGKLLFELGSSATLCGSGMAFKTDLYRNCLYKIEVNGAGFDKVLQAQIVKKDERIAFASKAIVYDEKTSHSKQLVKQRSRWINTWFKYFSFGFDLINSGAKNRSMNQLLFGIVLLRPPLFIFIILSFSCFLISIGSNSVMIYFWLLAFTAFLLSFYIALRKSQVANIIYSSLWGIPRFMFFQLLSLFFVKSANKRSVATKHQIDL